MHEAAGRSQVVDLDLVQVDPRLARGRPGPHGALRPGRQPDGARRRRRGRAGRGARPDDARAAAGRARRRPARDAGEGTRRRRRCWWTRPCATSRSCASSACRSGRAGCACAAPTRRCRARSASRSRSAARRSARATRRARRRRRRRRRDGAASTRCSRPPATARSARSRSARSSRAGALSVRPRRPARQLVRGVTEPDPRRRPDRPRGAADAEAGGEPALLRRRARDGGGGARRAVGLPPRLGRLPPLQPEADRVASRPGSATSALRAWSPEALDRRVAAIEATGLGSGWIDGDVGHGPAYRFTDPDGHVFELYYEAERYVAPEHLRPSWRNQPQRYTGRGACVKRLDHVNVLAADVRASREFAQELLGYRLYERIELDDGTETGAWMSLSIAAHELIYVADHARRARPAPPPRVLGGHARGVPARGGHLRRQRRRRSRRRRPSTASRRASSSTASSRAATGSR